MNKITYPSQVKYALFGKEVTWGTAVAATKDVGILIQEVSNPLAREIVESGTVSSTETQKITTGIVDVGVSLSGDFQHGRMLEFVLGSVSTVETTGDFKHTFTIINNAPSATFETGDDLTIDTVLTSTGQLVETAEISTELNANLQLSLDFKGKTVTSSAAASASIISNLAVFPHALVEVKINGIAATEVQSASISISKVVERSGGISSNLYQQGHAVEIKFEFTASLGFQDSTFHQLFLGGTTPSDTSDPADFEFEINADNAVVLGSGRREFKLVLQNCQMNADTETTSIGSLTFIDISGNGIFKECFTVDNISGASF